MFGRFCARLLAMGLLALALAACANPAPEPERMSNDYARDAARSMLRRMSLEEKVGQLFMVHFPGSEYAGVIRDFVEKRHVGGVILYNDTGNITAPEALLGLVNDIQAAALEKRRPVPLFVGVDQEGGRVARLKKGYTQFPANMAVGAGGDPENARLVARTLASELAAVGVNLNFAPVVDVNNNPANPVIGTRSFGSVPDDVAAFGAAAVRGYEDARMLCTAKHFPGHGDTDTDSHKDLPVVTGDRNRLETVELPPFRQAIQAGVPAIMTAHVYVPALEPEPGIPATLSENVLTGMLREELGFEGLIVTDSLFMGAIRKNFGVGEATVRAFKAGADVLLLGGDLFVAGAGDESIDMEMQVMDHFLEAARSGEIPEKRIDESVQRILACKLKSGIMGFAPLDPEELKWRTGTRRAYQIALSVAREGLTLVRAEEGSWPVGQLESLALVYPEKYAALAGEFAREVSGIRLVPVGLDPSQTEIRKAVAQIKGIDRVIVAVSDVRRHPGQKALVRALRSPGQIVAMLGSPYDALEFPDVPCCLATYGAVPASLEALAEAFADDALPPGRLPIELPGISRQ